MERKVMAIDQIRAESYLENKKQFKAWGSLDKERQ